MNSDQGVVDHTMISAVHHDIIRNHILTKLDGPTLASAACTSAEFQSLTADDNLWRGICNENWPSTADPSIRRLISTFPAGHRSFYSDTFPSIHHRIHNPHRQTPTSRFISGVDIRFRDEPIFSRVHEIDTSEPKPAGSTFRVDLLGQEETVQMPVKLDYRDETCQSILEQSVTLTWIMIDPDRKRAVNISSSTPVSTNRNYMTGDVEVRYVTVVAGRRKGELVQFVVMVACGGKEAGGELQVREVSFEMRDIDGKNLMWKDSLVILQEALVNGKRRRRRSNGEEREGYEEYLKMKRERRERKKRRAMKIELATIATGVLIFTAMWVFLVIKFLQLFWR